MPTMPARRRVVRGCLGFTVSVALVASVASPALGAKAPKNEFTTYSLAGTPPQPAGTTCPGAGPACANGAAEPGIRAAADGSIYASSENGLGAGTLAWKSTDGGRHFRSLLSPNNLSQTEDTGFAPGGGDTDTTVATARNAAGQYNVYVSSLTLANIDVSTSTDGGATWTLHPITTPETIDDREWIAADGASKVCISYHNAPQGITVGCSTDAAATFTQFSPAIDALHAYQTANNEPHDLPGLQRDHLCHRGELRAPVRCAAGLRLPRCLHGGLDERGTDVHGPTGLHQPRPDDRLRAPVHKRVRRCRRHGLRGLRRQPHHLVLVLEEPRYHLVRAEAGQPRAGDDGGLPVERGGSSGQAGHRLLRDAVLRRHDGARQLPDDRGVDRLPRPEPQRDRRRHVRSDRRDPCRPLRRRLRIGGHLHWQSRPVRRLRGDGQSPDRARDNRASNAPGPNCTPADTNTASCDHTAISTQLLGKGIY